MASTSLVIRDYRKEIPGKLSTDKVYSFPTVYSLNKKEKQLEWSIHVSLFVGNYNVNDLKCFNLVTIKDEYFDNKQMPADICALIYVQSCQKGGKTREAVPTIIEKGKSIGKKNETNVWCQALRDALSQHNKQTKKSAVETDLTTVKRYPPLLAKPLGEIAIDFSEPVYVQRKYNGVRTVATLDVTAGATPPAAILYSRKGHLYPGFTEIKKELKPILDYYAKRGTFIYLDGENYAHGVSLQDISGQARREVKLDLPIKYMVYDVFVPDKPMLKFTERLALLEEIFSLFTDLRLVEKVETYRVGNMDEVNRHYKQFLSEGFEGAMIRTDHPYVYSYNDHHSKFLLKLKPTYDGEFKLTGYTSGKKGKAKNSIMLECETADGKRFDVTPALEIAAREKLLAQMGALDKNAQGKTIFENRFLNKMLVVTYDELSKDLVPQRARTKMLFRNLDTDEHYNISAN